MEISEVSNRYRGQSSREWRGKRLPSNRRGEQQAEERPSSTRVDRRSLRYRTRSGEAGRGFEEVYKERDEGETTYYFSGVNRGVFIDWIAEERRHTGKDLGAMVNANSASQPSLLDAYVRNSEVPLVLDSGAYQGNDEVGTYMETIKQIDRGIRERGGVGVMERFDWVAQLDVIDGIGSGANFWAMRERGIEPLWVSHVTGIRSGEVRPTINMPPPSMSFELHEGMTIGIGGLVPVIKNDSTLAESVIEKIGTELSEKGLKGHFFGVGEAGLLKRFSGREWFASADSAKWLAGQKARKVYREDGSYIRAGNQGLSLTREECARQNLRQVGNWCERKEGQRRLFSGKDL